MKQVIRYECQFCKKDFKTPNRHKCKKNPELKNCFTCKHLKGWDSDYLYDDYRKIPFPECAADISNYYDWELEEIKRKNYNMQCEKWEEGKYDWSQHNEEFVIEW